MPRQRLTDILAVALVLGGLAIADLKPANASSSYDGRWYVVIRTLVGGCLPTMGYQLMVKGGEVFYHGGGPIRVGGRVDDWGRVNVGIRGIQRWAHALGQLSRDFGSGTWRGTAPGQVCTGKWQARRGG